MLMPSRRLSITGVKIHDGRGKDQAFLIRRRVSLAKFAGRLLPAWQFLPGRQDDSAAQAIAGAAPKNEGRKIRRPG
jgi:hypothetical protein